MLALQNIHKRFPGHFDLRDISFTVNAGQTLVFLGPSGCGKSTVLRLINGLESADGGQIVFMGETITAASIGRLRLHMGYMIQDGGLFPHLTAGDNVRLMARHLRWSAAVMDARVQLLANTVHLPLSLLHRYPATLSGGERQRVALMRALLLDPTLLLLDEPLGALDPMIRYELQSELKALFQTLRKAVVLVTHDLSEAAWFADRIVLMRQGAIEQTGPVSDLLHAPASPFVEQFVLAQRDRAAYLR